MGVPEPRFFLFFCEEEEWKEKTAVKFDAEIFIYLFGVETFPMVNYTYLGTDPFVSFVLFFERSVSLEALRQCTQHLLLSSRRANNDFRAPHFYESKT